MKILRRRLLSVSIQTLTSGMLISSGAVFAQDGGDDAQKLEAIQVTSSRIKRADVETQTPVMVLTAKDIEATGLGSVGDILQRLSVSGSSLNTKFNSAGNFGFPPDGGGVGSGSATVSLRNLGAKRTLVLVDGLRWVSESSASGVSAAVDLNTLPASVVERIEILTDGASSLYGSDAVAGVVNIITKKKQDGGGVNLYYGDYSTGDGQTKSGDVSLGGSGDRFNFYLNVSYFDQNAISSNETEQSRYPVPGTGVALGSSAIPTTRTIFFPTDPNNTYNGLCPLNDGTAFCNITANGTAPNGIQSFPTDFHRFTSADRFNFAPYNLLLTPSERTGFFGQTDYKISDNISWYIKGLYNTRKSANQAAPEPIFLGPAAGSAGLADLVGVDVTNPYNPFGVTLNAGSNLVLIARRPLEGGPRVFSQDVDTWYGATGLTGTFDWNDHSYSWDINYVNSKNKATQTTTGTYNIKHIQMALGPLAGCNADPNCVPLNIFGGPGSITPEMLKYIQITQHDRSENALEMWTANLSGDLFEMPAGPFTFATGYEHRRQSGFYQPDSSTVAGESNGVPSGATSGSYSVNEFYVELNVPLLADVAGAKHLDLSIASRYSDYSNFGDTTNNKLGLRWQPVDDLTLRGTYAEGFRAPSIGELFGTFSRFDATLEDPCSKATDPATLANCKTLGTPTNFEQANTQISVITGGNPLLQPETSESLTLGAVYSPTWAENVAWSQKLDFELTYFNIRVDDAIQARDAQTQLNRCVATLGADFCTGITRSSSGDISRFNNTLQNLGRIRTRGYDFGVNWVLPETDFGNWSAGVQTTYTSKYEAIANDTGLAEPRAVGIEVNDSAIPKWRTSFNLNWLYGDWKAGYTARYISGLTEKCGDAVSFPVCSNPATSTNHLSSTTYHDARVSWKLPVEFDMTLSGGVNNFTDKDPPICLSCSLNGYDASTYDIPGRFWYVQANMKF